MRRLVLAVATLAAAAVAIGVSGCGSSSSSSSDSSSSSSGGAKATYTIRLQWAFQTQFAGFIVAEKKGWYKDAGVNVVLKPAGPNTFPQNQVATGADDFGVPLGAQTLSANSSGAHLVDVMQHFQDSTSAYMAWKSSGIKSLKDVKGHRVGLWFGGNQFEFLAMLKAVGLSKSDVQLMPQGETVTPFLSHKYDVSQVTRYNEMGLVADKVPLSNFNIFYGRNYGVTMLGDGLVTSADLIKEHPDVVQAVVDASIRGWKWAIEHPEDAAKIAVSMNKQLNLHHQVFMMEQVAKIVCEGPTLKSGEGLGWNDGKGLESTDQVLKNADQLKSPVNVKDSYTNQFVEKAPAKYRKVNCGKFAGK